jgi:hypothetical protein
VWGKTPLETWLIIARCLVEIQQVAMHLARANLPTGRAYNSTHAEVMERFPNLRKLNKGVRSQCVWLAENEHDVLAWLDTQPEGNHGKLNHPAAVQSAYRRAHKPASEKPVTQKRLKEANTGLQARLEEVEADADTAKRERDEASKENEELQQQVAGLTVQSESDASRIEQLETENAALRQERDELKERLVRRNGKRKPDSSLPERPGEPSVEQEALEAIG